MARQPRREYAIAAAFDTETTNVCIDSEWHAFVTCYQVNDLRDVDLHMYNPACDGTVHIYRNLQDFVGFLLEVIEWGHTNGCIPVVCGYNLMFDMQTVFHYLVQNYDMEVSAQSSTNVYTLDLLEDKKKVLRFWDTFHLEMRGLSAMGETSGLYKLAGDWDYDLIRTPETKLTQDEIAYASRDVEVIPDYLRYLLSANEWLQQEDFASRVLTKTSLVRQMAAKQIGPLKSGKKRLDQLFMMRAEQELPGCYYDYGLRKACFLGGWTFTSARYASTVVRNVASLDVTSMHHTYINGRMVPQQFRPYTQSQLEYAARNVLHTKRETILKRYFRPFDYAFHMRIKFTNIRLKKDTCFDAWGLALIPRSKFGNVIDGSAEYSKNDSAQVAEVMARLNGWKNTAEDVTFAFGKLYKASCCTLHVTELELWNIGRVYEWDSMECILGEGTAKFQRPPDYVVLQSNIYYARKDAMKRIVNTYREGVPYTGEIDSSIPKGIVEELRRGTATDEFVMSYYQSTVKGSFNGIYGTQAQDVFRPEYEIDTEEERIQVNHDTTLTPVNFFERLPKHPKVMYCYGMRIVGGSRMHMVIACELLHEYFGDRIFVTGGDTDSVKVSCAEDVTDDELLEALEPIAVACRDGIATAQKRVREEFPKLTSSLDKIGEFDIEKCGATTRYDYHMDVWNKARASIDSDGKCHITCAGLSRPAHSYQIERYIEDLLVSDTPENVLPQVLGYNVHVPHEIAHALQRTSPEFTDRFRGYVTDYKGDTVYVDAPEAIALYPVGRVLGETDMAGNAENVAYVHDTYGRDIDTRERYLAVTGADYDSIAQQGCRYARVEYYDD